MASYCYVAFIFLSLYVTAGHGATLQTVNGRIHIMIGKTAGCRFAQMFMSQVAETNRLYGRYVDIEFLPWGRTVRNPNGTLTCQFGEADCFANRVQRCALNMMRGNQNAQVRYMQCEYSEPFPALRQRSLACSSIVNLNIVALDYCVSTRYGDSLEGPIEARGREGLRVINSIPYVVFHNRPNVDLHNQVAWRGLTSVVCNALLADRTTSVTRC